MRIRLAVVPRDFGAAEFGFAIELFEPSGRIAPLYILGGEFAGT
jgi:hypothetical protein